jgi:hypothetical protein
LTRISGVFWEMLPVFADKYPDFCPIRHNAQKKIKNSKTISIMEPIIKELF